MKKIILLVTPLFLMIGCSQKKEPIMLVCDGTETTYVTEGSDKGLSETRKVKKTFKFYEEEKELKIKHYISELNVREGKLNASPTVKKRTWLLSIDDSIPFFEEDSVNRVVNAPAPNTEEKRVSVLVGEDTLYLNSVRNYKSEDMNTFTKHTLTINRNSGVLDEEETESGKFPKYKTGFIIKTEGNCKKTEKKF